MVSNWTRSPLIDTLVGWPGLDDGEHLRVRQEILCDLVQSADATLCYKQQKISLCSQNMWHVLTLRGSWPLCRLLSKNHFYSYKSCITPKQEPLVCPLTPLRRATRTEVMKQTEKSLSGSFTMQVISYQAFGSMESLLYHYTEID